MKNYGSVIFLLLMVTGCSVSGGSVNQDDQLKVRNVPTHESQVIDKEIEFTIKLTHPESKEVIYSFLPSLNPDENDDEELKQLAKELSLKFDQPMVPSKLDNNGKLINGVSRVILDEEKLVTMINNVKALDKEMDLPLEITAPNVTEEAIKSIEEIVIGSYKTSFNPGVTGRTENISLSANAINQIVLGPGDRFYFNLVVGERTTARGYQKAMEIVDKEFVEGIGGGICQTSSTLFNAVDNAGLDIIELHSHSRSIGYVPKGRDATVSWNGPDFKFMNNKDYPVMIKTFVNKSSGTIEVQVTAAKNSTKRV
ncbi:VanW family protein [Metabacillus litoralis]|uniref:VanW family protein n=1 Tax=Metabacillus litoralis TaxID=152268 RepID=UPI001CFD346F|nr:VanW family protein [Metabacillus litoralis]